MSLRQIALVLKREYLTRIRSKAFIVTTLLVPLGIVVLFGIGFFMAVWESETEHTIGIVDQTDVLYPRLKELNPRRYTNMSDTQIDSIRSMVIRGEIEGYIVLTETNIDSARSPELVYGGGGGVGLQTSLRNELADVIREERLSRSNVSDEVKQIFETRPGLDSRKLTQEGRETEDDTGFLTVVGMFMGIVIFTALFSYGGLITRSVIEEKTNRIIEVITSSVKPIELLVGKIFGVAALGLTQFAFWIVAFLGLGTIAGPLAATFMGSQLAAPALSEETDGMEAAAFDLPAIEPSLIVWFIVFFLLGYFIYSSLFAAIGAAVDSETDTQQLMLPIMTPILIAYLLLFRIMEEPDSSLAVITSIIPFFSPILMVTRIAITDVPLWELSLTIVLMIGTFTATMWLSAKIYSVGILSYGKSAGYKELLKWIRQ
jgi:ABC-2 type transport system permease protein